MNCKSLLNGLSNVENMADNFLLIARLFYNQVGENQFK